MRWSFPFNYISKTSCFRRRFCVRVHDLSHAGQVLRPERSGESPRRGSCRKNMPGAYFSKKKPPAFAGGSVFEFMIYPMQARYCDRSAAEEVPEGDPAVKNMPVAYFSKKKPPTFVGGLMFALLTFPGRPGIVFADRKCPVDICRQKKSQTFV